MTAALLLHWPLDAPTSDGKAADLSPNHFDGAFAGGPAGVLDSTLGGCVRFDGVDDYATLPGGDAKLRLKTGYTLSAWIKLAPGQRADNVGILCRTDYLADFTYPSICLGVKPDGTLHHPFSADPAQMGGYITHDAPGAKVGDGAWHHVAVTNDGRVFASYLDGVQLYQGEFGGGLAGGTADFRVGSTGKATGFLPGQLAHLRIYDTAQSVLELRRDMAADGVAAEDLENRPLDFTLVNDDQQAVLYIDEAATAQSLALRVTNTSRYTLESAALGAPSAAAHHFALHFRKGTLAPGLTITPGDPSSWAMAVAPDETALYLTWQKPVPLVPGAAVEVRLDGLNADGAAGTRGTRVQLTYQGLHYSGETEELSGSRLRHLDVVNHRGRRDLPVDVRLVGGDRVLSDGATQNTLVLHLTNMLRDGTGVALGAGVPVSAFTVSYDVQQANETRPWALSTAAAAGGATLRATDAARWNVAAEPLGQQMMWTVTPKADTVLKPGEFIELTLAGVIGLASEGHAPIVVDYRNIPGFADGLMSVPVERSPLVTTTTGVGIGTNVPRGALHIGSDVSQPTDGSLIIGWLNQTSIRFGRLADRAWIQSHGPAPLSINPFGGYKVGIGSGLPSAQLHVLTSGAQEPGDGAGLWVGQQNGANVQIGQSSSTGWIQSAGHPLAINPNGAWVGIGAGVPQGKVHILSDNQEPNGPPALVISAPTGPSLRFGHNAQCSWAQAQNGPLAINPLGGQVTIGPRTGQTHPPTNPLSVSANDGHLQLRRETPAGPGGRILHLELFQDDTAGTDTTHPCIRFHHSNKFWHRIEAAPDGLWFQEGNLAGNGMVDVHAGTGDFRQLKIGGTVIGERELQVLANLAAGKLQFDLYNVKQDEYAYAADYKPYDDSRRSVWTWRPKGRVDQGVWRIDYPRW